MNKVSQNDNNLKEQKNISRKNIIICNYNDRNNMGSGELGPITNSAWSIFWRIRIACLEDSAHPSGELGLPPSELGLPKIYYKITY